MIDECFGYIFLYQELLQNITGSKNNNLLAYDSDSVGKNSSSSLRQPRSYDTTATMRTSSAYILVSIHHSSIKGIRIPWKNG